MDGRGRNTSAAIHQEIALEIEAVLRSVFAERRTRGGIDLEAVEMAIRSALHQAGAKALSHLLLYGPPARDQRLLPCACGQRARYLEVRTKPLLTALGRIERPYYLCPSCHHRSQRILRYHHGMEQAGFRVDRQPFRFLDKSFEYLSDKRVFVLTGARRMKPVAAGPPRHPSPGSTVFLELTSSCNLACPFCYLGDRRRRLGVMPISVIRKALELELEQTPRDACVKVVFLGGEPLIAWDRIVQTIRYCKEIEAQEGARSFSFLLVTNGTLLDRANILFLRDQRVDIQLSVEGPPPVTERLRRGQQVNRIVELLHSEGVEPWLKFTITPQSLRLAPALHYCLDVLRCPRIGVEICASRDDAYRMTTDHVRKLKAELEQGVRWLERTGRLRDVYFYYFPDQSSFLRRGTCFYPRWGKTSFCGAFSRLIAVDVRGAYYSCPLLVGVRRHRLGDVRKGKDTQRCAILERELRRAENSLCRGCLLRELCGGICPAFSHIVLGDPPRPYDALCEFTRLKIEFGLYVAAVA